MISNSEINSQYDVNIHSEKLSEESDKDSKVDLTIQSDYLNGIQESQGSKVC